MIERRPLVEGLKPKPETNRTVEEQFVYGEKAKQPITVDALIANRPAAIINRVPFTTRVRTDIAAAVKRASLERQLEGIEPSTVQDILESALEPWLKANGYLP